MLGRSFVCAIVMMGIATPAAAGERSSYSPLPDALRLLLQDEQTTFGARTRAADPQAGTLATFETVSPPTAAYLPDMKGREGPSRFALEAPQPGFTDWPLPPLTPTSATFGARDAIADAMANHARPPRMRGRSRLDTMLTFRLDGEEGTQSLSMRGPASVLNLLPVR